MIVWNIWRQSRLFKFRYDCTGTVKRCQASGAERLGQLEQKFVNNYFTNTNIRNFIDNSIDYSQYQIPDKILVSNFMYVRPRSLMSESL